MPFDGQKVMSRQVKVMVTRSETSTISEKLKCRYPSYVCGYEPMTGYEYCLKHILEDKSAPYKQCNFIYNKSGRRCNNAAMKADRKDVLCDKHIKHNFIQNHKISSRQKPAVTQETLLWSLDHSENAKECLMNDCNEGGGDTLGINAEHMKRASKRTASFDYMSDSESELDHLDPEELYVPDPNSGNESDSDDCLRYAGVFTDEEAVRIMEEKMTKLKAAYIMQMDRLKNLLKCSKRKYLLSSRKERETYTFPDLNTEDPNDIQRLKCLYRYHRRCGIDALFRKKLHDRRLQRSRDLGYNVKIPSHSKCIFSEGGSTRCAAKCVPLSRYCPRHILQDPQQVLFKPCGNAEPDITCSEPIIPVYPFDKCMLHQILPPIIDNDLEIQRLRLKDCPEQLISVGSYIAEQGGGDNFSSYSVSAI